jgi:hypothetical protein
MSALTSEIAERARQHRDEIIELLARLSDPEDRQADDFPQIDSPREKQREIDPEIAAEIERIERQALALGGRESGCGMADSGVPGRAG